MGFWQQIAEDWAWYRSFEGVGRGPLYPLRDYGFWIIGSYRFGRWARHCRVPLYGQFCRALYQVAHFFVFAITGADLRTAAEIGRRCTIHTYGGLLVADNVVIGDDCRLYSGAHLVYLANDSGGGAPRLGNRVRVFGGAKVLGGVTLGDDVWVGANAVVIRDVPAGCTAFGIPARSRPRLRGGDGMTDEPRPARPLAEPTDLA